MIPLTVVFGTTAPWPESKPCLDRLCPGARAVGAEIIVAQSSPVGTPATLGPEHDRVRVLTVPGASVFELRRAAIAAARGDIIAVTEDHCVPATDWCQRILAAHAAQPDALVIAGAVTNGSPHSCGERANFLLTLGPYLPPLQPERLDRAPAMANVTFKRAALPARELAVGELEFVLAGQWKDQRLVRYDDRLLVEHVQWHGWRDTLRAHFDNGRSTTGLVVAQLPPAIRRQRLRRCFKLPRLIVRGTQRMLHDRPEHRRWLHQSLPIMWLLAICHASGEFTGLLWRGAGRSPYRLH